MSSDGLGLSRRFYEQLVGPVLDVHFPHVPYSAARIGWGSEVLGYDTNISTDHDFGPTVQIFLSDSLFPVCAGQIMQKFDTVLPAQFEGFNVCYSSVSRPPGAEYKQPGMLGSFHGVEFYTVTAWFERFFRESYKTEYSIQSWLGYSEQLLLTVTAGAVFRDDTGELTALRKRLSYFPRDVWLYKLSVQWGLIAEESEYVGRAGEVGDELGSRVIAARMVEKIMRLAFLIEQRYAPYPKWFGSAFSALDCADDLCLLLEKVLLSKIWQQREDLLRQACQYMAELQLKKQIPGATKPSVTSRYSRPFKYIDSLQISNSLKSAIIDKDLREMSEFGGAEQIISSNFIRSSPVYSRVVVSVLQSIDKHV
ncbi:DUF4037 domain-containing protein [Salmonella enterica]|nr:DUF4037 domain-containing protein [Salmonella enterica]